MTAASDAKEIENFYVAKKNVVDNILFEPMPRYSVNVSLKFYTETKTLAMVKLTAAEVAEECYKICVENKQTLPGAEVLEKCMVAAKRYKCDHSAQGFKELTTNTELLDDPVDHPASHRYWQRNTLRWTATSPASSHLLFLELRQVLVSRNLAVHLGMSVLLVASDIRRGTVQTHLLNHSIGALPGFVGQPNHLDPLQDKGQVTYQPN